MGGKQADVGGINTNEERKVGSYRLISELASGGMASVWLAQHESWTAEFTKRVAIKLVHPHLLKDPAFVRMFMDEARVSLQVNHPNVCSVLEVGVDEGSHFLVLEYLQGASLSHVLKAMRAGTRPGDLQYFMARVIAEAAEGLHAAHEVTDADGAPLDIVHRDVSPHNLMLTRDGAVKVVDFGIARTKERLEHTDTGFVKGKVAYLAPEQISGGPIDRRADVWALGVCLWEGLMLENPFQKGKDTAQTMAAITSGPLDGPKADWVHPDLAAIVCKAVRREATERCTNARELSLALRTFLAKREIVFEAPQLSRVVLDVIPDLRRNNAPPPATNTHQKSKRPVDPLERSRSSAAKPRRGLAFAIALVAFGLITIAAAPLGEWKEEHARQNEPPAAAAIVPAPLAVAPVAPAPAPVIEAPKAPEPAVVAKPEPKVEAPKPVEVAKAQEMKFDEGERIAPVPEKKVIETPRPRAEAAVQARKKGTLRVYADGGQAEVRIDGVAMKLTPAKFELEEGKHSIELRKVGTGEFAEQPVTISSGVETTMRVSLEE